MNPLISTPVLYYNLSKWVIRSFFALHQFPTVSKQEVNEQIDSILSTLPGKIVIDAPAEKPIPLFIASEVERLNLLHSTIENEARSKEVFSSLEKGKTTPHWTEILGYKATTNPKKFMKNVKDRVDFYSKWHSTGIIPQSIDFSLVTNIRGLLNAHGNEIALQRKSTTNVLSYEFHIGNNCNESSSGLLIT